MSKETPREEVLETVIAIALVIINIAFILVILGV